MKIIVNTMLFLLMIMLVQSCDLIEGVFRAGVWVGILVVLLIVALIIYLFSRMFRRH